MTIQVDASHGRLDCGGDAAEAAETAGPADPADLNPSAQVNPAQIIAEWRSYLPEDCVATMIKMGWHRST